MSTDLKPETLLIAEWIPTYKTNVGILSGQLTDIRSMLFVLEHIAKFPFPLFGERHGPFWGLVRRSLETSVVVGLWRILLDDDPQSLTLRRLRNLIMTKTIDDSAKRLLADGLRDADRRMKETEAKVNTLRQQYFAHLDEGFATRLEEQQSNVPLTLEELQELATAAHDLINAVGMGTEYMTLFLDYDPKVTRGGKPIKSDIESLFDDIVARCDDLRLPELKPYEFPFYWKHRTPRERLAFNSYRKKFNLPEVPTDT